MDKQDETKAEWYGEPLSFKYGLDENEIRIINRNRIPLFTIPIPAFLCHAIPHHIKRWLACVNACAGVPTIELHTMVIMGKRLLRYKKKHGNIPLANIYLCHKEAPDV